MTKSPMLLLVFLLVFHSLYAQDTGWVQKDNCYELKVHDDAVKYAKLSSDKKSVFTSDFKTIKKWDLETGELIETKILPDSYIKNIVISPYEKYYSIVTYIMPAFHNPIIKTMDFQTDSVLNKTGLYYYLDHDYIDAPSSWLVEMLYLPENPDELIIGYQYWAENGSSVNIYSGMIGINVLDSTIVNIRNMTNTFSYSPNMKYLAYSNEYHVKGPLYTNYQENYFYLKDIENNIDHRLFSKNYYLHDTPNILIEDIFDFAFSHDSKKLAGKNTNSELIIWETDDINFSDTIFTEIEDDMVDIVFSVNDKFILMSCSTDTSSAIKILDPVEKLMIDTISFDKSIDMNFVLLPDTSSFIVYCSDGYIRRIYNSLFYDSLNAYFATDERCYEPMETIQFHNYSSGQATSFYWMFGDGFTSTETNPTHFYTKSGEYSVTLIASDGANKNTYKKNEHIIIRETPVAKFIADSIQGLSPLTVNFTNESYNEFDDWLWDFGDGTSSDELNPVHVFESPGSYDVSLYISNECYLSEYTKTITVNRIKSSLIEIDFEREFTLGDSYSLGMAGQECGTEKYIVSGIRKFRTERNGLRFDSVNYIVTQIDKQCDQKWANEYADEEDFEWYKPIFLHPLHDSTFYSYPLLIKSDNWGRKIRDYNLYVYDILETDSGIVYLRNLGPINRKADVFVEKEDNDGNVIWSLLLKDKYYRKYAYREIFIDRLDNGKYLAVMGITDRNNSRITLISPDGVAISTKIAVPSNDFNSTGIIGLNNSNFIICGYDSVNYTNGRIIRYDENVSRIWDYNYQHAGANTAFFGITKINEEFFAVTGCFGGYAGLMILDINGTVVDDIQFTDLPGQFNSISLTSDTALFMVGTVYMDDGESHIYTVKTKPLDLTKYKTSVESVISKKKLAIYPNPVNNELTIVLPEDSFNLADLHVFNSYGNQVAGIDNLIIEDQRIKINTAALLSGIYYFKISSAGQAYSGKFVVVR